jgi:hypothetical protein
MAPCGYATRQTRNPGLSIGSERRGTPAIRAQQANAYLAAIHAAIAHWATIREDKGLIKRRLIGFG